ncbi:carbon-nitrogen hydrolase family protein [Rhodopirellula sp. JC740]|uniref:Carbon-nitrogen hydrolase family protein n=1 Tax=Rhodopirellula halodulae TaxID=2894198 RepID=A0ABS8NKX8_9BACT|nr:carbon-nitrogen hydrolase family protein [Rhodopirellula sp. JC740]MCC9643468.1 carbon-nitrogen hydrolase family protein [Rhodopirellula sp. JC740]
MLLACVQTGVHFAEVRRNVESVSDLIDQVSEQGVELAVFPECVLTGYGYDSREEALAVAPTIDSPEIDQLVQKCGEKKLAITFGTLLRTTRDDGADELHNSALLIDGAAPTGPQIIGRYNKVHLPHLGVDRFVDRGEACDQVFEITTGCRVGLGICYDSSFPEPMRALGLAGADVIALGTNWPVAAFRTAEIVPPARSMENHLFFVAANRIGNERNFDYCGLSSICGPDGVELARAPDDSPIILTADIQLEAARNKRIERTVGKHVIDRFADRQPNLYSRLSQSDS